MLILQALVALPNCKIKTCITSFKIFPYLSFWRTILIMSSNGTSHDDQKLPNFARNIPELLKIDILKISLLLCFFNFKRCVPCGCSKSKTICYSLEISLAISNQMVQSKT